jgi:hypothetical protein
MLGAVYAGKAVATNLGMELAGSLIMFFPTVSPPGLFFIVLLDTLKILVET